MPDWEKIEFTGKSLKRKETYNEFGKKVRFEPLESIPKLRRVCNDMDSYQDYRETPVWKEDESLLEKTSEFVKLAIEKGFSEEQALHIFYYNDFDKTLSECDLEIYKPLVGMTTNQNREIVNTIIDNIKHRISTRQNRDLNLILMEFPAHTMGELLDFYANNRMSIKRKTIKYKSKFKGIKQDSSEYLSFVNPLLCGSYLYDFLSVKNQENCKSEIELTDLFDLTSEKLDKTLANYSTKTELNLFYKEVDILAILENPAINLSDYEDTNLDDEIDCLFTRLDEIETWMKPAQDMQLEIRHKWDNLDISLLLLGLQQFGTNFQLLADVISTKTEAMIQSFYLTFKDRYQLDKIALQAN